MATSAALAFAAPDITWFYLVFALAGIVNAIFWTSMLAMTAEFGSEHNRPFYIGLTNTLIAPAALIAPLLGGWLADAIGFEVAFVIAAVSGFLMALVLQFIMRDPRPITPTVDVEPVPAFSPAGD
jgi:MFS family permease